MNVCVTVRLATDCGIVPDLFKTRGRQLSARVAIDAGGIHEKVTWNVRIEPFLLVGHQNTFIPRFSRSAARQRYQAAAVRNGLHRSPYCNSCCGVGIVGFLYAMRKPLRRPKSSTGKTSGRPS